ncbi:MAG TPA: hypothetical protein VES65_08000 [Solirubrobacteraceae bacterium]|nr:hypothetical protein [Solirubrobacteraceae bacterium]
MLADLRSVGRSWTKLGDAGGEAHAADRPGIGQRRVQGRIPGVPIFLKAVLREHVEPTRRTYLAGAPARRNTIGVASA